MTNNIIYLSYFLDSETPLYGGSKGIEIKPDRSIRNGDTANTKKLVLGNHSGTHIDFPNHFFENGKLSHDYEASFWIFNAPFLVKVNAGENELISFNDNLLESIPVETDFLILKTGFGNIRNTEAYWNYNPGLHPSLASALRLRCPDLRVIGMDFISVTSFQNREIGRTAHKEFLGSSPILLVEDMDLSRLEESPRSLMCFPLMLNGADGAPVTVIAVL
jgi:arylformamidase